LEWLLAENDDNNNLFPDGYGMMEIHGLSSEMIDVASYTQKAFVDAAYIADELGKPDLAASYREKATELAKRINEEFWSQEFGSYADFIGTDEQALHLIDDAIIRADTLNKPWAVEELKATRQAILNNPSDKERPFVVHHNWVVNTPMEVGIADPEKALIALETAENFVNPFGMFVTGIDRDESAGSDDGSFQGSKIFSYTGAVMTLPTGVQVVAENNYGRPDQALNYLQRMTRTFSYALPGSMYEVSPDYGMMTQAWNIYSYAVPIVSQFFGVQPMASEQTIYLKPQMPTSWDNAKLENVLIGDKTFTFDYSKDGDKEQMRVLQEEPNWKIAFVNEGDTTRFTARISQFNW
jgi:glycogen debranching enzyme